MTDGSSRILGIDPGSRLCGWGLVEVDGNRVSHVDNGVIVLTQHGEMPARLGHLLTQINRVLDQYRPTDVAVEEVFQYRNARTALVLGHARGVAIAACSARGLPISAYTPMQIKKAVTGTGRASKDQIQHMVALRMKLAETPQEDAADAVAAALCHAQYAGMPTSVNLTPKRKRKRDQEAALLALAADRRRTQK